MKLLLPKPHLSHSAIKLWETNRERFRSQYYVAGDRITTKEMRFGTVIHKLIEDNDESVKHIPRFDVEEKKLKVEIDGVPILGFIDSYHSETGSFLDYKTGHANKSGTPPWNPVKVRKHDQLPFYAMLLDEIEGTHNELTITKIVWIETEKIPEQKEGALVKGEHIVMTGRVEVFERVIQPYEKKLQRDRVIKVAQEISEDYKNEINKI